MLQCSASSWVKIMGQIIVQIGYYLHYVSNKVYSINLIIKTKTRSTGFLKLSDYLLINISVHEK